MNHLTLNLFNCKRDLLFDEKFVRDSALKAIKIAKMKKIGEACVVFSPKKKDAWGKGISLVILIAESHLSIHTLVEHNSVAIDLFSCKKFDKRKIIKFFVKTFRARTRTYRSYSRNLIFD